MRHRFARFIIYAAARPAMAAAAAAACGVWVLMAARRKQSGNKSNSKSNCKSHASKYSAVAVYSGKQAKQLRQERQQTVCAVAASKGSTTFAPALAPSSSSGSSQSRKTCNAQRATCHMQLAMAAVVA